MKMSLEITSLLQPANKNPETLDTNSIKCNNNITLANLAEDDRRIALLSREHQCADASYRAKRVEMLAMMTCSKVQLDKESSVEPSSSATV